MPKYTTTVDIFSDERLAHALTGATAPAPEGEPEPTKVPRPPAAVRAKPTTGPAATAPKSATLRFRVSKDMRVGFQKFKAELSAALGGVVVDDSNLGRALIQAVLEERGAAILEAARASEWEYERPAGSDGAAMAAFDEALAAVIGEGLGD